MMIRNFRLTISYDGTRYQGWQKQKKTDQTIQGKLEEVLMRMMALEWDGRGQDGPAGREAGQKSIQVIGAGRTDAGVHARAMTANVWLDTRRSEANLQDYCNRFLPEDISVDQVKIASDRFHSRFQAIAKTYCYSCYCGRAKPVFDRRYVTILEDKPDLDRMRKASAHLLGNHDFKSFCGNPKMKKSTWRRLDEIRIVEEGDYLRLYFRGNAFLQNMVRILTGTLLEVGFGRMEADHIPEILAACDRSKAGPTAPAKGLCMMEVHYD